VEKLALAVGLHVQGNNACRAAAPGRTISDFQPSANAGELDVQEIRVHETRDTFGVRRVHNTGSKIVWGSIAPSPQGLFDDLGDDTTADCLAAFPNSEVAPNVEGHRLVQADGNSGVVAGHDHLDTLRQTNFAGDVCGLEEELRLVAAEERRVPSPFVL